MQDVSKTDTIVSEKVLADAKKKLKDLTADWTGGVCNGTVLDLAGSDIPGLAIHTACHSWVSRAFYKANGRDYGSWDDPIKKDSLPFLVLTCHSTKRCKDMCSDEAVEGVINWIAHDSPWSEYILNRDDPDSLNDGAIILCGNGGVTHAEAVWICKFMRYSTESPKSLETWWTLYKNDVNPFLASFVCTYVGAVKGATFGYSEASDHVSVFYDYGDKPNPDLESILNGKINKRSPDTASVFQCGGKPIKTTNFNQLPENIIKGFCTPVLKDDGWGGKIRGEGADEAQLVAGVLAWQAELTGQAAIPEPVAMVKEKNAKPAAKRPDKNTVFLEMDL